MRGLGWVLLLLAVAVAASAQDPAKLFEEGSAKLAAGEPKGALPIFEKSLAAYQSRNDPGGEAQAAKAIGNCWFVLGEYGKSIEWQNRALTIAVATGDRDLESRALMNIANATRDRGDPQGARPLYERALAIAKALPGRGLEARCRHALGAAEFKLKRYEPAAGELKLAAQLAHETHEEDVEAGALVLLGEAYEAMKRPAEALAVNQQLLPLVAGKTGRTRELLVRVAIANTALDARRYDDAIRWARESLALAVELGNREMISASLQVQGSAEAWLGGNDRAIQIYEQLVSYSREWKDEPREAGALNFLGQLHVAAGDYLKAIDVYQRSLGIARKLGDAELETTALGDMGRIYVTLNALTTARGWHVRQLAVARRSPDQRLVYDALQKLGDLEVQADQYRQALDRYRQSADIAKAAGEASWEARAWNGLASVHKLLRDFPQVLASARRALDAARNSGDEWEAWLAERSIAWAYQQQNDPKCLVYLERLVEESRRLKLRSESVALYDLGAARLQFGNSGAAIAAFEESLKQARSEGDSPGEGMALDGLADALMARREWVRAEAVLQRAVEVWEAQRARLAGRDELKVSVFERQAATYRNLQVVQVARNRIAEALETAERGRARAFVELLSRRVRNRDAFDPAPAPISAAEIRRLARDEHATLVEYSIIRERSEMFVYVVDPAGTIGLEIVPLRQSVAELVASNRNALGVATGARGATIRGRSRARDQLGSLYELLVKPVEARLPAENHRVVFLPQQELFFVPFAALRDAQQHYLVEKYAVTVAPSIQVLELAGSLHASRGGPPLVVGNPVMPSVGTPPAPLPALPGTEKEAREIGRLLGVTPALGAVATKPFVLSRMPEARLVHLATHGLLEDTGDAGVPGAVALAPSRGDDGLLTANEILDLKLRAELVVLSACDSGRGRITGDGVIGLSRAFLTAGVPAVVVSLWPVADESASALMLSFYRGLAGGRAGHSEALRAAMRATMKTYPNPADWAAFTLIGHP